MTIQGEMLAKKMCGNPKACEAIVGLIRGWINDTRNGVTTNLTEDDAIQQMNDAIDAIPHYSWLPPEH